jgi:hypothetical protein
MDKIDYQYRYNLASNIPKFIAFFETTKHLDDVDPYFTPFEAAEFFLNFWSNKYENILNNLLHKNFAEAYKEQLILSQKRFQNGGKLFLADFKSETSNFFDENYPQFSNSIFLMETFYPDPSMFFETFPRVFYIENTSKNGALAESGSLKKF